MQTEYSKSLQRWASSLSDAQLATYIEQGERLNDDELAALHLEDARRMGCALPANVVAVA